MLLNCADIIIKTSDLSINTLEMFLMNTQHVQDILIIHRSCSVCLILHNTPPGLQICADLTIRISDLAHNYSEMFPMNSQHIQDVWIEHRSCSVCLILHNTPPVLLICIDLAIKTSDLAHNDLGVFPMNTQHVQDVLIMHRSCSVCVILHNTLPVQQICADLAIRMSDLAHNNSVKLPMNSHNVQDVFIIHRSCSACLILHNTPPVLQICADLAIRMSDLAHIELDKFPMNTQNVQDVSVTHRSRSVCVILHNTPPVLQICADLAIRMSDLANTDSGNLPMNSQHVQDVFIARRSCSVCLILHNWAYVLQICADLAIRMSDLAHNKLVKLPMNSHNVQDVWSHTDHAQHVLILQ